MLKLFCFFFECRKINYLLIFLQANLTCNVCMFATEAWLVIIVHHASLETMLFFSLKRIWHTIAQNSKQSISPKHFFHQSYRENTPSIPSNLTICMNACK